MRRLSLLLLLGVIAWAKCPNSCSGHGDCTGGEQLLCVCHGDFTGGDCSQRKCPTGNAWADAAIAVDTAHQPAECSNRGTCDSASGTCQCQTQYYGKACERRRCPGSCSGHGVCTSLKEMAAANNNTAYTVWEAEKLYGCVCDPPYTGTDCSQRLCPRGDDPLTTGQVDEVQVFRCTATSGSLAFTWGGSASSLLAWSATAAQVAAAIEAIPNVYGDSGIAVTFASSATQLCSAAGTTVSITFRKNFGSVENMGVQTSALVGSVLSYFDGAIEPTASVTSVMGTKESEICAGRGTCDETTGLCTCFTNFGSSDGRGAAGTRGDCGYQLATIASCAQVDDVECAGRGVCSGSPSFRCQCGAGLIFGDCSQRSCPYGYAWFDTAVSANDAHNTWVECSGAGICDRATGACACQIGFEGGACERLSCPTRDGAVLPCAGHGQCMSMRELARDATLNGVATTALYGATPGNPLTWDADRVLGCDCDEGWTGFDCTQRSCPVGDDPQTPGNREVQVMQCTGGGGTFFLTFRAVHGVPATTSALATTITAAGLETALEGLQTTGDVDVRLIDTTTGAAATTFCNTTGSVAAVVSFLSDLGDLPAIAVGTGTLTSGTITVYTDGAVMAGASPAHNVSSVQGTTEAAPCANRGICSTTSGRCSCFTGFGSSDSTNAAGKRGDCGFKLRVLRGSSASSSSTSTTAGGSSSAALGNVVAAQVDVDSNALSLPGGADDVLLAALFQAGAT